MIWLYGTLKTRWVVVYGLLGGILLGAAITFINLTFINEARVETEMVTQTVAPKEYQEFVDAYGAPVQDVPGEQIDPSLQGAKCAIFLIEGEATVTQATVCRAT